MKLSKIIGLAAVAAVAASISPASASTVVFGLSNTVSTNQPASDFPLTLGMDFTVNSSITVDSLGAFTNGTSPLDVKLYNLSTGLIASTTVGAPVAGDYAFNTFGPPVTLTPGNYQINAVYLSSANGDFNPFEPGGGAASPVINLLGGKLTFLGDYYNLDGNGGIALTHDLLSPNGYGAGTFTVSAVPEPSTWAMMLLGFAGVGFVA
jgi:hypothetical protein